MPEKNVIFFLIDLCVQLEHQKNLRIFFIVGLFPNVYKCKIQPLFSK